MNAKAMFKTKAKKADPREPGKQKKSAIGGKTGHKGK